MYNIDILFFCSSIRCPPVSTLFPYTTLFRSTRRRGTSRAGRTSGISFSAPTTAWSPPSRWFPASTAPPPPREGGDQAVDRKSTRLNSSHVRISYAVFCLKKKNQHQHDTPSNY